MLRIGKRYTELNDPIFRRSFPQSPRRSKEEDSMAKMDHDFIRALRYAMPDRRLGIGIDRLVAMLTNTTSIREVICSRC